MKEIILKTSLYQWSKSTVGSVLRLPLIGNTIAILFHNRIPSKGCRINTRNKSVTPATKASLFWGLYERNEIRFVQKFMRPDYDVVDLGSSIGAVSAHIRRRLNNSCQLVCVEANPVLLSSIRENTRSSSGQTTVVHGAIHYADDGNSPEFIHLSLGADSTESKIGTDQPAQQSVKVPAITLSEVLTKHKIGKYVLVSDIEGSEIGFIEKDAAALSQCQQLIIELHETQWNDQPVSIKQLCKKLEQQGFQLRTQRDAVFVFDKP